MKAIGLTASVILALLTTIGTTHAQLLFNLTPDTRATQAGSMVTFSAALENVGATELFLNGDSFDLVGADLTVDDTKFLLNAPLSLLPGQLWAGDIFDVQVGAQARTGSYTGSFTIFGGANTIAQENLGIRTFSLLVQEPAAIPEPPSFLMVVGGLSTWFIVPCLSRKIRRGKNAWAMIQQSNVPYPTHSACNKE